MMRRINILSIAIMLFNNPLKLKVFVLGNQHMFILEKKLVNNNIYFW